MRINVRGIIVEIRRPLSISQEPDEIILPLALDRLIAVPRLPDGYHKRAYEHSDGQEVRTLLSKCGFVFTEKQYTSVLRLCVPNGVHILIDSQTDQVVSVMMSRHLSRDDFLFGGRIDWLATDPRHRGRRLGETVACMATHHLRNIGYENIWVTTQKNRADALKIFHKIGFRKP